jgi:hypothetical protein
VGPAETPAQETEKRKNNKQRAFPSAVTRRADREQNTVARPIPTGHCFQSTKTKRKQESPPYKLIDKILALWGFIKVDSMRCQIMIIPSFHHTIHHRIASHHQASKYHGTPDL